MKYGIGGKGFIFDGNKVSIWWNDEGIRVAYGERANGRGELLPWERIDKRIGELLEIGRLAPQESIEQKWTRLNENKQQTVFLKCIGI